MTGRGMLTPRIQERSKALMGYEITTTELRLMPYLVDCSMNQRPFVGPLPNYTEVGIIGKWANEGRLTLNDKKLKLTKAFWDICCEMIWLGYVDL